MTAPTLEAERAAFEEWARNHLGQGYPLTMDEHVYEHPVTRWAFRAWQAARTAALASADVALPLKQSIDTIEFRTLLDIYRDADGNQSKAARAELIAYIDGRTAGTAPEGWQLAPSEPTPTMCRAGFLVSEAEHDPAGVYRAMLDAAPSHSPAEDDK